MATQVPGQGQLNVHRGTAPGTLVLSGELDMASAPHLAAALRGARRPLAGSRAVLDLRDVTFMDVTALRMIETERRRLLQSGVRLVLRGAVGEPARLLQLLGPEMRHLAALTPEGIEADDAAERT